METVEEVAEALAPPPSPTVTLSDGRTVTVEKCKVINIGIVVDLLRTAFDILDIKGPNVDGYGLEDKLMNPSFILQLISECSEKVTKVGASLCSLDSVEFNNLDMDDAMLILKKEWDINSDFFLRKILPMVGVNLALPEEESTELQKTG